MAIDRLKAKAQDVGLDQWRVAKKIRPGQRGAIKLSRVHGERLLCVRYRENLAGTERLTTVELVVERVPVQKRVDPVVSFKIRHGESDLRYLALAKGATYDGKNSMWKLRRSEVIRLGLKQRIAVTIDELYQEQVHP